MNVNSIYAIDDLNELELFLAKHSHEKIREALFAEFLKYSDYKKASDWNKAVRLCECLAITGWGKYEAVQAVRAQFFNGNPETAFINKFKEQRFVNAIWSKRKDGLTMEQGRTWYWYSPDVPDKQGMNDYPVKECIEALKLADQRNWIPRNPVSFNRHTSNHDKNAKAVIDSIANDLIPSLDKNMTPEKYGKAIQTIVIYLNFSFTNPGVKQNYIIADEKLNLKEKDFYPALKKMYSRAEIEKNGLYLRNRYEYGNFRNGIFRAEINFEKELNEMEIHSQKQKIGFHAEEVLSVVIGKLKKKKIEYDFDLMQADFLKIMNKWKK